MISYRSFCGTAPELIDRAPDLGSMVNNPSTFPDSIEKVASAHGQSSLCLHTELRSSSETSGIKITPLPEGSRTDV